MTALAVPRASAQQRGDAIAGVTGARGEGRG